MKGFLITVSVFLLVFWICYIGTAVVADYQYDRDFGSYWSLADKASRLDQKADYINTFTSRLEASGLRGSYNALLLKTTDNSFDKNFEALKSLQSRMEEIRTMDARSFEYQQAISQITAQEQGEAKAMIGVLEGCWYVQNHILLWDWVAIVLCIFMALLTLAVWAWTSMEIFE